MGPGISDYNKRLILSSVIQLSGGHCIGLTLGPVIQLYLKDKMVLIDSGRLVKFWDTLLRCSRIRVDVDVDFM